MSSVFPLPKIDQDLFFQGIECILSGRTQILLGVWRSVVALHVN